MGDLDKTSIIILVCVLTAAVITICLIAIIVYRKKWCRRSEDQPKINASISISDIHEYDDEDELKGLTGYIDDEQLRVHSSSDANAARGSHKGSPTLGSGETKNAEQTEKPSPPVVSDQARKERFGGGIRRPKRTPNFSKDEDKVNRFKETTPRSDHDSWRRRRRINEDRKDSANENASQVKNRRIPKYSSAQDVHIVQHLRYRNLRSGYEVPKQRVEGEFVQPAVPMIFLPPPPPDPPNPP